MSRPYNCDVCGMDLKRVGKVEITKKLMYKTLIVTKEQRWKCPTGCELRSINVNLNKAFSESSGDAVLEDSTSPKKAEPEAEKTNSESREQEHEQR